MYTNILCNILMEFIDKNPLYNDNGNMEMHLNVRTFFKRIRYEMSEPIDVDRKIIKNGGPMGFSFMGVPIQINDSIPEDFIELKTGNGVSLALKRLFPLKFNFLFADGVKSTDIMYQGD